MVNRKAEPKLKDPKKELDPAVTTQPKPDPFFRSNRARPPAALSSRPANPAQRRSLIGN